MPPIFLFIFLGAFDLSMYLYAISFLNGTIQSLYSIPKFIICPKKDDLEVALLELVNLKKGING